MQLVVYAQLFIIACLPLIFMAELLDIPLVLGIAFIGVLLARRRAPYWHYIGITLLFFVYSHWVAVSMVSKINSLSERPVIAEVVITEHQSLTGRVKFSLLKVDGVRQFPLHSAWANQNLEGDICMGQRWKMKLVLRPVHSLLNEGGYDSQRNALAKATPFTAKILNQQLISDKCSLRHHLEMLFIEQSAGSPWQGISRALVFGLRDQIPVEINQRFRETGIGHLMAISGMHIGLIYLLARRGITLLLAILPLRLMQSHLAESGGWLASALYCFISGAQPSALRAMLALTFWLLIKRYSLNLSSFHILLLCVAGLLAIDPIMILSDSLWLSALAVFSLLLWYRVFPLPPAYRYRKRFGLLRLLHLQLGMMLLLLPVQIFFFHGMSLTALTANIIAIPIVSLTILPLSFLFLIPLPNSINEGLIFMHDTLYSLLFYLLAPHESGWRYFPDTPLIALGVWGALLLWRIKLWRYYPLSISAIILSVASGRLASPEILWRVDMLDVGHGLAVVISQQGEGIIYDTGNRWQTSDAGERVIIPWLIDQQITPIAALISHRHSDHSGGLASLKKVWPTLEVRTTYPYPGRLTCQRGDSWQWRHLTLRILWPESALTAGQNNDSCVVSVSDGQYHLLLTGDIEKKAEQQLVAAEKGGKAVTWLQVPHHGSRTSSSPLFVRTFSPQVAIASVARYNAWRLPAKAVVQRYHHQGVKWLDTAQSGQLSIRVKRDGVEILQFRDQISPRWYHQWFGVKPDYG
ncbi:DNA internalization-related competence protein ComEC/Rec2 [Rosenbergiella epipactidis]|uniref:DNA internalization-related competence protein ComEC/Rec2 n=1 Tax=Rosenbergiella epipactidis TaxID=1544694 RepID=UPI00202735B0|nr:DNA internalization-related competence protein ComEC/Rec2 [Rosenbergiella epipactidis]MCL9667024.1 DNA internalization-related competence protein ComEC/Rec2 [Rosenbergiella epipactidis]